MTNSPDDHKHISIDGVLTVLLISALAFNVYCVVASGLSAPGR